MQHDRWLKHEYRQDRGANAPKAAVVRFEDAAPPSFATKSLNLLTLPVRVPVAIGAAIAGWVVGLLKDSVAARAQEKRATSANVKGSSLGRASHSSRLFLRRAIISRNGRES